VPCLQPVLKEGISVLIQSGFIKTKYTVIEERSDEAILSTCEGDCFASVSMAF